jgi:hypothetical protein
MKVSEILFRPSEIHKIMSNPRVKKTNLDRYNETAKKLADALVELGTAKEALKEKSIIISNPDKSISALEYNVDLLTKQLAAQERLKDLPNLSKTCTTFLKRKYIEIMYNRREEIDNKYMKKGRECEEAGIDLYSMIKGKLFVNNKIRVSNSFFTGEIDLPHYDTERIMREITDIKNSYSAHTFIDNLDTVKDSNKYQGLSYMDLHPTVHTYHIANVLVDNTPDAILLDLHRESYKWEEGDVPAWRDIQIVKNHIYTEVKFNEFLKFRNLTGHPDQLAQEQIDSFVEIPAEARLIEHTFERDEVAIQEIKDRIIECREWLRIMFNLEK